jgi:hypothetical protein
MIHSNERAVDTMSHTPSIIFMVRVIDPARSRPPDQGVPAIGAAAG